MNFRWLQIGGPDVVVAGSTTDTITFTAPDVGPGGRILTFQVTVDDDRGGTGRAEVSVTVFDMPPGPTNPAPDVMIPPCGACGPLGIVSYAMFIFGYLALKLVPRRWESGRRVRLSIPVVPENPGRVHFVLPFIETS